MSDKPDTEKQLAELRDAVKSALELIEAELVDEAHAQLKKLVEDNHA